MSGNFSLRFGELTPEERRELADQMKQKEKVAKSKWKATHKNYYHRYYKDHLKGWREESDNRSYASWVH